MKVGIITFHRAVNYGAVLQTYALQKQLDKMCVENYVIQYLCARFETIYKSFDIKGLKSAKYFIRSCALYPFRKKKNAKFKRFIKKNIRLSHCLYQTKKQLITLNSEYDAFITGSDQVWNAQCTNFDSAYFLDFVTDPKKKSSYAASFGFSTLPEEYMERYKILLNDFNGLSVREQQGKGIVQRLLHKEASVNIDPTLLLSQQCWENIAKYPVAKDYILIYMMQDSESLLNFAIELSRLTNLRIVYIHDGLKRPIKAKYIRVTSPEEFVGYIANAKYIVTNGFHGLIFSIIWHKLFFAELQRPPATENSRLENILELLGLRSRQIIDGKNRNIEKPIDYIAVEEILEKEREKSIDYLKQILGLSNE